MDAEEIAKVLAEHLWHHTAKTHCACGFRAPLAQLAVEAYCAHLAAVLAPLVEQAKREAWDAAINHVWELSDPVSTIDHAEDPAVCTVADMRQAMRESPYRAERAPQTPRDGGEQ